VSPRLPNNDKEGYIVDKGELQDFHIDVAKMAREADKPKKDWKHS